MTNDNKPWWQPAIMVFAQVSAWIAGPIIIALYLGEWLDNKYNTGNLYFYICISVAFVSTNVGLVINVIKYAKKIETLSGKKEEIAK